MKLEINKLGRAILAIALIMASTVAFAQQFTVTGVVTDENHEPLIGVSVVSSKSKAGVATNVDGTYRITLNGAETLNFTYVGMQSYSVKVNSARAVNVVMKTAATSLDDVVVVGYGTQKKVNLTGSVQSIGSEDIVRRSVSNGSNALQGVVPGLTAVQSSGQPGADQSSLKIRGLGSLNSTVSPLVLIDGVEGDMNRIDLNSVESITVLKDAASASIYGSRASNGVILVTTKRGAQGKIKVSFNGYVGFNKATTMPEQTSAVEYMQAVDHARANNNMEPLYTNAIQAYLNGEVDQINYYDTDWRSEVLDGNGMVQNYSVSASGGTENLSVYASAGYYKQNGLISNNTFDRTTLRLNSDMKVNSWMKLGVDVSVRQATVTAPVMATPSEIIGKAYTMTPIMSGINADGSWGYGINGTNPIAMSHLDECVSHSVAPEYIVTPKVVITPFKGLTIEGRYTWKRNDGETSAFVRPYETFENGAYKGPFPTTGSSRSEARSKQVFKQYNLMGTYENTFAKHYVKALVGFQSEEMNFNYLLAGRKNFNYDGYIDLVNGDATTATNSSNRYGYSMLSYIFRLNYAFDNRYLLEVNGRYDGTSRFKRGNRWGFFPSFSAGWRISQESFWEDMRNVMDDFKLRASYGILGNQSISGYYPYSSAVGSNNAYGYWFDKEFSPGVAQTQLANPDISWEKSKQFDVGVDFGFLNSRLTGTFDFYVRNITDMLQQFPVPIFVGMTSPWENAGSMRNTGWEVSLTWRDRIADFNYYVKANLSDVKNKIIDLYGKEYVGSTTITTEGEPYGSWYGYVADGYFQSREEIDNSPVYGGNPANVKPGYIKYKDISGPDGEPDGKIDNYDRTIIGNPTPRYEFGLTLGGDWKGLDFSLFFQGVGKKDVFYSGAGARALCGNYTIYKYQLDTWTEDNRNAQFPLLLEDPTGANPNNLCSSFWVKSGAYLRLKNIVIGYTIPSKITKKIDISKVRFYASAQNLFTLKNNFYQGFDPETAVSSGSSCYPVNKTFLFGVNVEF